MALYTNTFIIIIIIIVVVIIGHTLGSRRCINVPLVSNSTTRIRPDPTRQSPRTLSETQWTNRVSDNKVWSRGSSSGFRLVTYWSAVVVSGCSSAGRRTVTWRRRCRCSSLALSVCEAHVRAAAATSQTSHQTSLAVSGGETLRPGR